MIGGLKRQDSAVKARVGVRSEVKSCFYTDWLCGLVDKFYFSITVSIQCYFVLISGVQHNGYAIIYFTNCSPDISSTH